MLRFYPPVQTKDGKKDSQKKPLEQFENVENPLRCPVKLYEFYLSKCPEQTKTRNDAFYLWPERSCVPDSPVWYSVQTVNETKMRTMLQRVMLVREVNEILLSPQPE